MKTLKDMRECVKTKTFPRDCVIVDPPPWEGLMNAVKNCRASEITPRPPQLQSGE